MAAAAFYTRRAAGVESGDCGRRSPNASRQRPLTLRAANERRFASFTTTACDIAPMRAGAITDRAMKPALQA